MVGKRMIAGLLCAAMLVNPLGGGGILPDKG